MPPEKQNVPGRMPERSEAVEGHQTLRAAPLNNAMTTAESEILPPEQIPPKPKIPEPAKRQQT
jgi:hypothetical protein